MTSTPSTPHSVPALDRHLGQAPRSSTGVIEAVLRERRRQDEAVSNLWDEVVQVAAVAIAWLECIRRREARRW